MRFILTLHGVALLVLIFLAGCSTAPSNISDSSAPSDSRVVSPSMEQTEQSAQESFRRPEPPPSNIPTRQSNLSSLKEIYFDFDRYVLRSDARETLKANTDWLRDHPSVQVQIKGHADERGTNEYNLALGSKRAQSTMQYLVALGISTDRISTISYGEELPVCHDKTEECWQRNRRAQFVITPIGSASLQ